MSKSAKSLGKGFKGVLEPAGLLDYYKQQNICMKPILSEDGKFINLVPKVLNKKNEKRKSSIKLEIGGIAKPKTIYSKKNVPVNAPLQLIYGVESWNYDHRILHECTYCGEQKYISPYSIHNNGNEDGSFRYRNGTGCISCMKKRPKNFWDQFRTADAFENARRMENQIKKETGHDFTCQNPEIATHTHNIKLEWKCNICGHTTLTEFYGLVGSHKHGCLGCRGMKITASSFAERLSYTRQDIIAAGFFSSSEEEMDFQCRNCNKTFSANPVAILNGKHCDHCGVKNDSLMAQEAKKFVQNKTGLSKKEVEERTDILRNEKTGMPLRPDIYVEFPNGNKLVCEIHGEQHYSQSENSLYFDPTLKERDLLKEEFCKQNKISFLALKQPIFQKHPELWQNILEKVLNAVYDGEYVHLHISFLEEGKKYIND